VNHRVRVHHNMEKVSIIIPARNERHLTKTVDDVFDKATGDIEVLVFLDGPTEFQLPADRDSLVLINNNEPRGLKTALNTLAKTATGKYLLKLDGHCMMGEGFDEILAADCERDWLAVPSKYFYYPETGEKDKGPIDYYYMQCPYTDPKGRGNRFGNGLFPRLWNKRSEEKIDDLMTMTGCCWFVHRDKFIELGGMDLKDSATLSPESEELPLKYWLSGGRVVRNKNTWFAHLWQKQRHRGYDLKRNSQHRPAEVYLTGYFMNNRWPKQVRDIKWLIDKFQPPGWPENWEALKEDYERNNPGVYE